MASPAVSPESVGVKVGDFFSASWGYDQTNVDWYKVVGLTPKGVKVQRWQGAFSPGETGGPADYVVAGGEPVKGAWVRGEDGVPTYDKNVEAPVKTKRLYASGYKDAAFNVSSYATAFKWDGSPQYQTGAGWGH